MALKDFSMLLQYIQDRVIKYAFEPYNRDIIAVEKEEDATLYDHVCWL